MFDIPDDSFGEALATHVDADPAGALTETAVREHVRARLAGYKIPHVVVFDDQLPREETGKISKRKIRDRQPGFGFVKKILERPALRR